MPTCSTEAWLEYGYKTEVITKHQHPGIIVKVLVLVSTHSLVNDCIYFHSFSDGTQFNFKVINQCCACYFLLFMQADVMHQDVFELIHKDDRLDFQQQLNSSVSSMDGGTTSPDDESRFSTLFTLRWNDL